MKYEILQKAHLIFAKKSKRQKRNRPLNKYGLLDNLTEVEIKPEIIFKEYGENMTYVKFLKRGNFFKWRPNQKLRQVYTCDIQPRHISKTTFPENVILAYYLPNGKINQVKVNISDKIFIQ